MAAPVFSVSDMAGALHALLPPGYAWPRDPESTQHRAVAGLASAFARVAGRGSDLLLDAFPATTYELVAEWEETLGLPGSCAGESGGTFVDRQRAIVGALAGQAGQSKAYYINVARALGYTITITDFKPFSVISSVSAPVMGRGWAHAWQVNGASYQVTKFTVHSAVSEPLAHWNDFLLACVLQRIKPAHTTLIFNLA